MKYILVGEMSAADDGNWWSINAQTKCWRYMVGQTSGEITQGLGCCDPKPGLLKRNLTQTMGIIHPERQAEEFCNHGEPTLVDPD